ncbi:MAG TPA: winged helix-turn-helix domain-containing protein [Bryobacteraceae bacterium]|nr:winged helix-turn-helix domain-containing protein [Bryobacteraceae bacterium]
MEHPTAAMLRIGAWCVNPTSGQLSRDGETARLDVRSMRLLMSLAERPGEVVSIDDLLNQVWPGVAVTPDSVYQAVASLRRLLGDDPKSPSYIATVPRLGYRMIAPVSPWTNGTAVSSDAPVLKGSKNRWLLWAGAAVACVGIIIAAWLIYAGVANKRRAAAPTNTSIAVLPFLDLTAKMAEEEFADGMTEELIDKLSKIPGLRVPPPTASFYFKGKHKAIPDIAKTLGVVYLLDGSVRKSGDRVRIAARLVRAENGYVIWTETYDRPWGDALKVQDDIAGQVTKALRASISTR